MQGMNMLLSLILATASAWMLRTLLRRQRNRIIMESLRKYIAYSNGETVAN